MAASGLSKVVSPWTSFYKDQKEKDLSCICLFGTNNSGKSTLCQLFNAYMANNKHPNLTFDDGKVKQYLLSGIISANSLKVETIKPILYKIEAKVDNQPSSNIIDIPTYALPPFNDSTKKIWTSIDSKVSFNYLLKSISSAVFVFVIDEKYTRAPMQGTRSLLTSFIDFFVSHPKELYDSTAIIISKCPAGFKLDTFFTRVEALIKKIEDPNVKFIDQWFQNMKARTAIFAFNKFNTEDTVKQQVKNIYKQLMKIVPYKIEMEGVKTFDKMKEENKEQIRKYLSDLSQGFGGLMKIVMQIPECLIKNQQQFQNHKNQLAQKLFGNSQTDKIQALALPNSLNILNVCFAVFKITNSEVNQNTFLNLLKEFVKYSTLSQSQDLYIGLKQRAEFFRIFFNPDQNLVDWDYHDVITSLGDQASKIKQYKEVIKSLKDDFELGKPADYYENLIQVVSFIVSQAQLPQSQFFGVWINSNMELAGLLPKPQGLKKLLQIETQLTKFNKLQLVGNLLAKIAQVLISVNRVGYAVSFYNKCGNPYKGIQQMSKIFQRKDTIKKKFKIKDFIPYLQFLQDVRLYEKCIQTCYLLGDIYETLEQRKQLEKFFNKPAQPKKQILQSFILKKIKGLDAAESKRIKQLAEELQKNGVA